MSAQRLVGTPAGETPGHHCGFLSPRVLPQALGQSLSGRTGVARGRRLCPILPWGTAGAPWSSQWSGQCGGWVRASQGTARCGAVPRSHTKASGSLVEQDPADWPMPLPCLPSAFRPSPHWQGTSQEGLAKALLLGFLGKQGCSSARGEEEGTPSPSLAALPTGPGTPSDPMRGPTGGIGPDDSP